MSKDLTKYALEMAARSPCNKRKVGAIITDSFGTILAGGYNYNPYGGSCEDANGNTHKDVLHAEQNAIDSYFSNKPDLSKFTKMWVTHEPCDNCLASIAEANINEVTVVQDFMKFDTDKLRYDLIPPSATKALAEVLTYGAKKYKPNNWRQTPDLDRYIAATMRHFEAYRSGLIFDEDYIDEKGNMIKGSGMPHLWHVLTNIAFLIELDNQP